jgi:hypothetical protein
MGRSVKLIVTLLAAVEIAACGIAGQRYATSCGVLATADWDHQSVRLTSCAETFGIPLQPAQVWVGETIAIVDHITNARLPTIQSSDIEILMPVPVAEARAVSGGQVVAAFRASSLGPRSFFSLQGAHTPVRLAARQRARRYKVAPARQRAGSW